MLMRSWLDYNTKIVVVKILFVQFIVKLLRVCYNYGMKYNTIFTSDQMQEFKNDLVEPNGVYIFISRDKALNRAMAEAFAKSLLCEHHSACGECDQCVRVELNKHPDLISYDKKALLVADANDIVSKSIDTPVFAKYKVFVLHNAEGLNEQAQNKLLKTLEEPNKTSIFLLTTSDEYKLLPTVLSRGRKVYLQLDKCLDCEYEFGKKIDNLTDYQNSQTPEFVTLKQKAEYLVQNYNKKSDIPRLVSALNIAPNNRVDFINILYKQVKQNASETELLSITNIFDKAIKRLNSNVNFNYVMDTLLLDLKGEK
ncbi:MAG: hypothetical protein ACLRFG_02900 [Clostridia bacterium]